MRDGLVSIWVASEGSVNSGNIDSPVGFASIDEIILKLSSDQEFASELKSACAELAAMQERLGPEFERVLFGNLEDLYEQ